MSPRDLNVGMRLLDSALHAKLLLDRGRSGRTYELRGALADVRRHADEIDALLEPEAPATSELSENQETQT